MEIIPAGETVFEWVNEEGSSPFVLVCEHASNLVPAGLNRLGLSEADLNRHIAYDIGAAGTARLLSRLLDAPLILQRFSRLIYDCNRPPEAPGAMPEVSEVFDIPGNKNLSAEARLARTQQVYRPFNHALEVHLDDRAARAQPTAVISIHSFTRIYKDKRREVDLGLLFDRDAWLAQQLVKSYPDVATKLNEPYGPKDGVMHLLNLHAAPRGLHHLMIEICNDLLETERNQQQWAQRLSVPLIQAAIKLGGEKI
ncbi:N-formylglutamate amidohydrolase [Aestuariivirga litoralis]|uniref:N-formylglutamate amidohydrolase n=1 Tax=Aestuariivirga litoralis TaxID=2650924 RepID=UPI0018C51B9C|nr:N-formylglutamate amidohydrolase [Aestuariivirga litoralis]MBG1233565.1 N-formylglutamate amidohydrolase [Aestuariivirga litoralis]